MPRLPTLLAAAALAIGPPTAGAAELDADTAGVIFREAAAACERDRGALFVLSLCGPLLLVDPATRLAAANAPDSERYLRPFADGVWLGVLPGELALADGGVSWAGRNWAMVRWPLPEDPAQRIRRIAHESFHRVQLDLGMPAVPPGDCDHLAGGEPRLWLRLELAALAGAMRTSDPATARAAAADALRFRSRRHELVPEAAAAEQALERHEGLAEYAGTAFAWSPAERRTAVAQRLDALPGEPTLVRSFAEGTGPAYALLLDALDPSWRRRRAAEVDVAATVAKALADDPPQEGDLEARAAVWGAAAARADEAARDAARAARAAELQALLVDGPVLRLPLGRPSFSFDPGTTLTLEGGGTVYGRLTLVDRWGTLTVTGEGVLVAADRAWAMVPAPPAEGPLAGAGWTLELAPGWAAFPGSRNHDLEIAARPGGRR